MLRPFFVIILFSILSISFVACKPKESTIDDTEHINLVRLTISDSFNKRYFFCENDKISTDTIVLREGLLKSAELKAYSIIEDDTTDVTLEILKEYEQHIILWRSKPAYGGGSLIFSGGNIDTTRKPLNNIGFVTTGTQGSGAIHLYVQHRPKNKLGTTPEQTGGITEFQCIFPVVIKK